MVDLSNLADPSQKRCWTDAFSPTADSSSALKSTTDAFHDVDWASTSLGPLDTWPISTRTVVSLIFQMQAPQAVHIGPEYVVVYNAAASEIYRGRHPYMMGKPYREAWSDLDIIDRTITQMDSVRATGRSLYFGATPVHFGREDSIANEESCFSYELVPVMDDLGQPYSVLLSLTEHTTHMRETQRSEFLTLLQNSLSRVTLAEELYETCSMVFKQSSNTIPFVRLYSRHNTSGSFRALLELDLQEDLARSGATLRIPDTLMEKATSTQSVIWESTRELKKFCGIEFDTLLYPVVQRGENSLSEYVIVIAANPNHVLDSAHKIFLKTVAINIANALSTIESTTVVQSAEDRFEEMIQTAPIGLNLEDETTREPIFINRAWRDLLKFEVPVGEIDTKDFASLLHPSTRDTFMKDYAESNKHNLMYNRDLRLSLRYKPPDNDDYHPDDNIWIRVTSTWLPPSYKRGSSILWTLVDTSEHKYLERIAREELGRAVQLQKLQSESIFERERADAAEMNAAKHLQYIDFSSHELRNPLGAIMQAADLSRLILESFPNPSEDIQEVLDHQLSMTLCAKHMGRIVDDTLSFSQLDHGALQIAILPCKLSMTAMNVLSMFRAELSVNKIELSSDIAEIGLVRTDASRFSQILINILTNSLKFAPHDGTGHIRVRLSAAPMESGSIRVRCSVRDNGPGMSSEVLDSLFQKFSQASAKTHVQYGGSGLGLYISKILTELLGGQIKATSAVGAGTELEFHIEVSRVEEPADTSTSSSESTKDADAVSSVIAAMAAVSVVKSPEVSTARKVLLIVEDNIVNQRLMAKLLSPFYEIHTANNGLECLNLMKSNIGSTVNLVLCDIEMPVMNGYEAVKEVKKWQTANGLEHVPFLAVSANSRPDQIKTMLEAGMDNTIRKPVGRKDILETVQQMLAKCG